MSEVREPYFIPWMVIVISVILLIAEGIAGVLHEPYAHLLLQMVESLEVRIRRSVHLVPAIY